MFFTEEQCEQLLSEFDFSHDARNPPDSSRQGRFKTGWRDAAERNHIYEKETLEALAWQNVGYRLGKKFGSKDGKDINEAFRCFADHYISRGRMTQ